MRDVPLVFVTEQLHLRRLTPEDLRAFANVVTDPAIAPLLPADGAPTTLEGARRLLDATIEAYDGPAPRCTYAVTASDDPGTVLGLVGLASHDEAPRALVAWLALLPEHRGRGRGREAARAIVTHGLAGMGARFVDLLVDLEEPAGVRTAEALEARDLGPVPARGPTIRRRRVHHVPGESRARRRR
jgi:RimJ/RimL family protein N-acetyltransferase